ncbi:hypothetical protein [Azospirillum halopraeferens]|uniref:hypothetical protein n=1 Tax=Azospirillum halopraeferens TaxID=34010 RepID=UPI0003FF671F|nr:hypothetical protein [Azospirillum halopraeferens]
MDMRHGAFAEPYETVRVFIGRLDRATMLRLYDHYTDRPPADGALAGRLGDIVLDVLNGPRRAHAQRLWMRWLEPAMVRDDAALAADRLPAGRIHAVDAGAWWQALAPRMGEDVAVAQEVIAGHARFAPIERVLASDEALRWAERLRLRSLAELEVLSGDPAGTERLLDVVGAVRRHLATGRPMGRCRPDRGDLRRLADLLHHGAGGNGGSAT